MSKAVCVALGLVVVACGDGGGGGELDPPARIVEAYVEVIADGERVERQIFGAGATVVDDASICGNAVRLVFDAPLDRPSFEEIACADGSFALPFEGCGDIGVLDEDQDGEADQRRLLDGVLAVACGDDLIPQSPSASSYADEPASELILGVNELPAASACGLAIGQVLLDRNANQPCAPDGAGDCIAGDASAIGFGTDCERVVDVSLEDGATDVPVDAAIFVATNVPRADDVLLAIELTDAGARIPVDVEVGQDDPKNASIRPTGGLAPGTTYALSLPQCDGVVDTVEFTTASR